MPGAQNTTGEYLEDANGCWIWQRTVQSAGYGMVGRKLAHRLYYERFVGPIPSGLVIDHLCRVALCVNPAHLEAVTQAENTRRGAITKLTADQVALIRESTIATDQLAAEFGVCRRQIQRIRARRYWNTPAPHYGRKASSSPVPHWKAA